MHEVESLYYLKRIKNNELQNILKQNNLDVLFIYKIRGFYKKLSHIEEMSFLQMIFYVQEIIPNCKLLCEYDFSNSKIEFIIYSSKLKFNNNMLPENLIILHIFNNEIPIFSITLPKNLVTISLVRNNILKFECFIHNNVEYINIEYNKIKKLKLNRTPKEISYDFNLIKNIKTFYKKHFYKIFLK